MHCRCSVHGGTSGALHHVQQHALPLWAGQLSRGLGLTAGSRRMTKQDVVNSASHMPALKHLGRDFPLLFKLQV